MIDREWLINASLPTGDLRTAPAEARVRRGERLKMQDLPTSNLDASGMICSTVAHPVPKEEPEVIPPVSKGEHFARSASRGYSGLQHACERLQFALFEFLLFRWDLKIVTEEVKANRQILEADAMRILSTWPWHAASGNGMTAAVK